MFTFPLLLTIYAGFTHAFETDHLLAVSSIVSRRNTMRSSLKDGIFWGLGHASTIFIIGMLMIVFKLGISAISFHYFEAAVGIMLVALAIHRLTRFFAAKKIAAHAHNSNDPSQMHHHKLAYGVGLIHGLAGSGALVILAMAQIKSPVQGLIYLLIFGTGCIAGMCMASGLFSIPFSKKIMQAKALQIFLILTSCTLCLIYGGKIIYENLFAQ